MHELKSDYTLVIVTHNMQQAARVADHDGILQPRCRRRTGARASSSSTTGPTKIFTNPADKRTEDYVTGRFG